jgi:hypothetical protein
MWRSVASPIDYTVSWEGKVYRIPREAVRPGLKSTKVRVEGRLDGTVWVRIGEQAVQMTRAAASMPALSLRPPATPHKDHNRGGKSAWMKNFDLGKGSPVRTAGKMAKRTE